MSEPSIYEVISTVANTVTAVAAGWAAYAAWKGISAWKEENIGQKKIELARKVIADAHEAGDIFRSVRSPLAYSHEGTTRTKGDDETDELASLKNAYFAPIERLNKEREFFVHLQKMQYEVIAHFGATLADDYKALLKIRNKIITSSRILSTLASADDRKDRTFIREQEAVIWEKSHDEIGKEIDIIIENIEKKFRPYALGEKT